MRIVVRRKIVVSAVAAIAAAVAGVGALLVTQEDGEAFRRPAAAVAETLGCADYQRRADLPSLAEYHDQGTCQLGADRVKVTTFADAGQQRAFSVLMATLVPAYTERDGAYAEGPGWSVADDVNLSADVAKQVADRMGGSVKQFSATRAGTTS